MSSKPCVFCDVISVNDNKILFQDDSVVAFSDIKPASKFHILVVPKEHISDAKVLLPHQKPLVEHMIQVANQLLQDNQQNIGDTRFGFHWPPFHTVSHLHLHAISPASEMPFLSRMMFKENSYWFVSPEYVLQRLSEEVKQENS